MAQFDSLYDYSSSNGIVIPQTSSIRENVEETFKDIFGDDITLTSETAIGRLVEAITLLFKDVCGINAQNVNGTNPEVAAGAQLDAIGALFGLERLNNGEESDTDFRVRILQSQSRGSGYVQSIRNAVSQVANVTSVCVLENGHYDPQVVPSDGSGISIPGHSIFVCVGGTYTDTDVANAIYATKSAGCGYTSSNEYGTVSSGYRKEITITDSATGSSNNVIFYKPQAKSVTIEADIVNVGYTGTDIADDAETAIRDFIKANSSATVLTESEIVSAVAASLSGVYCKAVRLYVSQESVDEIVIYPYEIVDGDTATVTITQVSL